MPIQVPQLQVQPLDIGNILRTVEAVKTSRTMRQGAETQNALHTEQLQEFREQKPVRQEAAKRESTLKNLEIGVKNLELIQKTSEAITNELVSITVDQYPAFVQKWTQAGISPDRFPPPEAIGNDPDKFKALQRQGVMSAKTLEAEILEAIKIQGAKDVENIKQTGQNIRNDADNIRLLEQERIKEQGAIERKMIEERSTKPTGDLAYFYSIKGRPPKNAAEFKQFRIDIKDDVGLNKEQTDIKNAYFQAIGRSNSAKRGEGQFVPDPNQSKIADQEMERANVLADEFVRAGGKRAQLGLPEVPENAPQIAVGDEIVNKKTKETLVWDGKSWVTPEKFQKGTKK